MIDLDLAIGATRGLLALLVLAAMWSSWRGYWLASYRQDLFEIRGALFYEFVNETGQVREEYESVRAALNHQLQFAHRVNNVELLLPTLVSWAFGPLAPTAPAATDPRLLHARRDAAAAATAMMWRCAPLVMGLLVLRMVSEQWRSKTIAQCDTITKSDCESPLQHEAGELLTRAADEAAVPSAA